MTSFFSSCGLCFSDILLGLLSVGSFSGITVKVAFEPIADCKLG